MSEAARAAVGHRRGGDHGDGAAGGRAAISSPGAGLAGMDRALPQTWANAAFAGLVAATSAEMADARFPDLVHPPARDQVRGARAELAGALSRNPDAPDRAAPVSKAYPAGVLNRSNWPPRVVPEYVG